MKTQRDTGWYDAEAYGRALAKVEPVVRTRTVGSDIYLNVAPNNVSVRDSFTRTDYEDFRQEEELPRGPAGQMRAAMRAYDTVGLVSNVIDLMSDFACKGLDLSHRSERIERFYKDWFRRVGGPERSERFLNVLFRCSNVVMRRQMARLPLASGREVEIPWRYHFLNPLSVELVNEGLAQFVGPEHFQFAVRIPPDLAKVIESPRTPAERALVAALPEDVRRAARARDRMLLLDRSKLIVSYYRRDDWKGWARPMIAPILGDIRMLEKMKLADIAALDGVISCIRVWKLGSLDHKIMPPESVILRLAEMLNNNVGGGVMDLVWGPDLELVETSTEAHRFLGETKYAPVLEAIFQGLGVPPTLNGRSNQGGFTNNYFSLKTLTEKLEYGRGCLRAMWEHEVRMVQQEMRFQRPAEVAFDNLLTDETAEKQLLLAMWDRDLVSDEYVQEVCGATPEIERARIQREARKRKAGKMRPKASPFHDARHLEGLAKIFAQTGAYAPSEMGVELAERKPGEVAPRAAVGGPADDGPGGEPGEGRPPGARDEERRKRKEVKPRTTADAVAAAAWARAAMAGVARVAGPAYLAGLGKQTMRELTEEEAAAFEDFCFCALFAVPRGSEVTEGVVRAVAGGPMAAPPAARALLSSAVARYAAEHGRRPPVESLRWLGAFVYATHEVADG